MAERQWLVFREIRNWDDG